MTIFSPQSDATALACVNDRSMHLKYLLCVFGAIEGLVQGVVQLYESQTTQAAWHHPVSTLKVERSSLKEITAVMSVMRVNIVGGTLQMMVIPMMIGGRIMLIKYIH